MLHIVLHQPEQPGNVGTIGRSCVCAGAALHLIEPIGFHITDRHIRRAGLDYWPRLSLYRHMNYETFLEEAFGPAAGDIAVPPVPSAGMAESSCAGEGSLTGRPGRPALWYVTTKAVRTYADVQYGPGDFLMFGKESAGIPEEILAAHPERCIRIPMAPGERSLNLSNSVSIVLYEALRQQGFPHLEQTGQLHHLTWKES